MSVQIPLTNNPNQTFQSTIPLSNPTRNITMNFSVSWNSCGEYWTLGLANANTGQVYFSDLPMITGSAPAQNLLRQYAYFAIGSAYIVPISNSAPEAPGVSDWGVNYALVWGN